MKPILRLSDTERQSLQKVLREHAGARVLHALILLLLSALEPRLVADLLGLGLSTLYDRMTRWNCYGISSLGHRPRSGRPRQMETRHDQHVLGYAAASPRQFGHRTSVWTSRLLSQTLRQRTGQLCSPETIRRHLHELKWSWKRPRHGPTQSPDPLTEQKLARLAEVKATLEPDAHLLYVDEADFHLLSPIRASWSPRGEQPVHATPGNNKRVYAFGAYDPAGKRFLYQVHLRKRCGEFKGFLKHLLKQVPGKIYLVLDNVRTHSAACIQTFVKGHSDRLELLFIPSYSPQYNQPIERVWGTTKTRICGNDSSRDVSELLRKVRTGLASFQRLVKLGDTA
jgi:transposase